MIRRLIGGAVGSSMGGRSAPEKQSVMARRIITDFVLDIGCQAAMSRASGE